MQNDVPDSLLTCEAEPLKLNFNTGNNGKDFKNIVTYTATVKAAGGDCRSKLDAVKRIIKKVPP